MLDFSQFEYLTFDCYGTLIDWEAGILAALKPMLAAHDRLVGDEEILEMYGALESEIEAGDYRRYRDVLRMVTERIAARLSFTLQEAEIDALPESLKRWLPFPDTVEALRKLKSRYKLGVISNTDNDLFAETSKLLMVPFDFVVTAEQARSYKPSRRNFHLALERIGLPKEKILHCAQSLFHDIVPAKELGIANVWVNRRAERKGPGATLPADAKPDVTVTSLEELARLAVPDGG
jgi:2-haloacid dehalogenase